MGRGRYNLGGALSGLGQGLTGLAALLQAERERAAEREERRKDREWREGEGARDRAHAERMSAKSQMHDVEMFGRSERATRDAREIARRIAERQDYNRSIENRIREAADVGLVTGLTPQSYNEMRLSRRTLAPGTTSADFGAAQQVADMSNEFRTGLPSESEAGALPALDLAASARRPYVDPLQERIQALSGRTPGASFQQLPTGDVLAPAPATITSAGIRGNTARTMADLGLSRQQQQIIQNARQHMADLMRNTGSRLRDPQGTYRVVLDRMNNAAPENIRLTGDQLNAAMELPYNQTLPIGEQVPAQLGSGVPAVTGSPSPVAGGQRRRRSTTPPPAGRP